MNQSNRTGLPAYYRWYILTLSAMTFTFAVAIPTMCMPVLFREIGETLDLSLVQIGTAWGMVPFGGIFVVLMGGLLSDRFGIKRVLYATCFLGGIAGASRGFSNSFTALAFTLFLFGLVGAMIPPVVHKACGVWFAGRHLGLANGIVSTGMAVGFTVGSLISSTLLSPLLGGWRNVLFLYGSISALISILWFFSQDERRLSGESGNHDGPVPFRQALSRIVRIKDVWVLGFILLGQLGCVQGVLG
ncbi:MAG: MFS transporter, partial [Deltaproteobacteria bacterium]|nr:MFS transporter [Deltaproteobacteria bacterium]